MIVLLYFVNTGTFLKDSSLLARKKQMGLYLKSVSCVSITCIRFNGYNLSRIYQHPVITDAKVKRKSEIDDKLTEF